MPNLVSREEAIDFLKSAFRNWSFDPHLSEDNIDHVAAELSRFIAKRRADSSKPLWEQDEESNND